MPTQQICTVISMEQLDADTWWMVLAVGKMVEQHRLCGGQFLHIKCGDGQLLRRPISVAITQWDDPEDLATLIFEVRGEGTRWLSQRRAGDKLDVLGPLGNGFHVPEIEEDFVEIEERHYLLVGGGIGVPPLIMYGWSMPWPHTAVLGFRTKDKAFPAVVSRFQEACEKTYLCTDDGTLGYHGFVDGQVRDIFAKDNSFTDVIACGPKPMLKSVAKAAAEFGIPCQVSMEERMACGIGACLGCAIRMKDGTMKHVCKDGPVFNAEEVDWDV